MAENATTIDCNTLIAKTLAHHGVTHIFGVVGSPVTSVTTRAVAECIRSIVFDDEQSAADAAYLYAFRAGRPSFLLTASGPGCVDVLSDAHRYWPMVLISGSSDQRDSGKGDFQELDQMAAVKPFSKFSVKPSSIYQVPLTILRAVTRATTDRPCGCYLDLSSDILHQRVSEDEAKALILKADEVVKKEEAAKEIERLCAQLEDVDKVVAVLKQAQQPLIVFGKDAEYARIEDEARKLVEITGIPFLSTTMGKGLIPDSHDMDVTTARLLAIGQCDVALVIGARLNSLLHVEWPKDVKLILVDACEEEIESMKPNLRLNGDAKKVVGLINKVIKDDPFRFERDHSWVEWVTKKVRYNVSRMEGQLAKDVSAPMLVSQGANTMNVPQMEPRTRLDAGTWETMGVGLCIAGNLAFPDRLVVAVEGDSDFRLSAMEVEHSMDSQDEDEGSGCYSNDEGSACYSKAIVAVIDGCRGMNKSCDVNDLSFLCDHNGLVDYKSLMNCCEICTTKGNVPPYGGINAHGYFCASIIASRRIDDASLGEINLGTLSGITPPPRIAIYAVGCPCTKLNVEDVSNGIQEAILQKANVVSISLMRELPSRLSDMDVDELALSFMDAFRANTLVVLAAGNYGEYGLGSIQSSPPWCLTVGSCTPKEKFKSKVEFKSDALVEFDDIEGYSISMYSSSELGYVPVRREGNIKDTPCIMYLNGNEIVIKASSVVYDFPTAAPLVHITKETSNTVCDYFERAAAENGSLYALCHSSKRRYVPDAPLVSEFSGRGPCSFFNGFMKPDLCAQGEHACASWPDDVPLGFSGDPLFAPFNVLSGTSYSTPRVAAGLAMLMVEKNFSVSATISAAITTADKMHGKDVAYEFAHGAGVFNLEKAMQVDLVYEETAENFEQYCFPDREAEKSCSKLNLPYFSATFPSSSKVWECKFMRKLKSVKKGQCIYLAEVKLHAATIDVPFQSIKCIVTPNKLVFEGENDEQTFSLSVYLPNTKSCGSTFGLVSGSLIWVKETEGVDDSKVVVDCPIILSCRDVPL